ncbi:MAG: hypothetical protein IPM34_04595 [Saprospiraceae bacterium]|nr:hypothetical protein [Saprospiraceae bacterium]
MNPKNKILKVEFLWLTGSCVAAFLFLTPLLIFKINYPFWISNLCFIIGAITCIRWIFLWKYTPYAWNIPVKISLMGLLAIGFVLGFDRFQHFKVLINDIGIQEIVSNLALHEQDKLSRFIRSEMVFWAVAFFCSTLVLIPKIFWSIWKQINRNEV